MEQKPQPATYSTVAKLIGTSEAVIRAVFEVEASGLFFLPSGDMISRFEPHQFPAKYWGKIGFAPQKDEAPWKASLRLSTTDRSEMFDAAVLIDKEAAYNAASWGAPQIMGSNSKAAGYKSAVEMAEGMATSADAQVRAFFSFVMANRLDKALRDQNWLAFATGYNGSGKAQDYAAKLAAAYKRNLPAPLKPTPPPIPPQTSYGPFSVTQFANYCPLPRTNPYDAINYLLKVPSRYIYFR